MADAIFGTLGEIIIQLGSHGMKEIGSAVGVTKELKKLEKTLSTIRNMFKDADEQQQNNHELTNWFKLIKDAMYEAEDIIDDFATEALCQKLSIQESSMKKFLSFAYSVKSIVLRCKMSRKIKDVREKFDAIEVDKNKFHLIQGVPGKRNNDPERGQTISFVVEEEVFGRDGDKDEILELLSNVEGESMIAIIGMGGLGKTTLAQLVYNHKTVECQFKLKMWVSVSQEFDVKKITEKAIESATKKECPNMEMEQLQSLLREDLKGKRFLLVLDDVWNEDSEKWDKLKILFAGGAKGSKIVVTTRSVKVASIMGAKSYSLKAISDDDCWKLFKERAFAKGEAEKQPDLVKIGKEMVNKCHGVPLAAKTLGSLMRFKTQEHEWVSVNNNDVWRLPQGQNDISPALRLSYNHLPFHLKQCFTYCAALSRGQYDVLVVIAAWISEGFVYSSDKSQRLEDIGYEYVQELLWRSLFSEPEYDQFENLISFKVHDLVHNLAHDVVGTEFYFFEGALNVQNEEEVRYVNLLSCPPSLALEVVCKMPNLRTLSCQTEFPVGDIFSNFKSIRNLTLHVVSGSLPSAIGKLKHLRMLCIRSMYIQTIPNSITKLLNLQTLHLRKCPKLTELPNGIGRMINLRCILIDVNAPISYMPQGLGNLVSLQTLPLFVVGKGTGFKLNELQGLIHLNGTLTIKNLQNITSLRDCEEANLKQKKKLEWLDLQWDDQEGEGNTNGAEIHVSVMEKLEPHSNIKALSIVGYRGSEFPRWITEPVFPRLKLINLYKCRKCVSLPTFGQLPSLKFLAVEDMDALRCLGENGIADRNQAEWFSSLKKLWLLRIPNLESWNLGDEENLALFSLPCLEVLVINDCPKLRNIPLLPSIEILEVKGCSGKLVHLLLKQVHTSPINYLEIGRCDDLESLPVLQGLTQLQIFIIKESPRLVHLSNDGLGTLTSLVHLEIEKLPELVSLPQWVQNATNLQTLKIEGCEGLIHLLDSFGQLKSLRYLAIFRCHKLQSLPDGIQQLTALESLSLYSDGLMSWPNGLGNLTSLRDLMILCSANLPYLPEELHQLTALHTLDIGRCQILQILPEYMKNFTSLQELHLFDCQNLQCLPEWISRLKRLRINYCEKLTSRCKKEIGEDWHKIARIPNIELNEEIIQNI